MLKLAWLDVTYPLNGTEVGIIYNVMGAQPTSHRIFMIVICAIVLTAAYAVGNLLVQNFESSEPPTILHKIPYFGHVMGLVKYGITYYLELSTRSSFSIYSIRMFTSKIYVVNSPELVSVVQRNSKTLSPYPFIMAYLQPLLGLDDTTLAIIKENMYSRNSYAQEVHAMHQQMLASGSVLNQMQNRVFQELSGILNSIQEPLNTNLYSWVQEIFTQLNTSAVWGRENPFTESPDVATAFWNVEEKFHLLILNIMPSWTAAGAVQDRERLVNLFAKYHEKTDLTRASHLVQQWARIGKKHGLNTEALARIDIGLAQALLVNTVPITAWMLLRIFSDQTLLTELRGEVEGIFVTLGQGHEGKRRVLINFGGIKKKCPLLVSTWHEVLRMNSYLPSGRTVLQDTIVQDQYLLKKDATVFIFSGVLHSDARSWGNDVARFNPRRFIKGEIQAKPHPAAFRPFGGGHVMCPGRVFAFNEVLTFVASVISRYDIQPENGHWPNLKTDIYRPSLGVYKPKKESIPGVIVSVRKDTEGITWEYPLQNET